MRLVALALIVAILVVLAADEPEGDRH